MRDSWIRVDISRAGMTRAIRDGALRQAEGERCGYEPYGAGSIATHTTGRLGEIAFAQFLGVTLDPDPSYQADRARGCDITGPDGIQWHVRARSHHGDGLIIRPRDPAGVYALIITADRPRCYVVGWYSRQEAENGYPLTGMVADPHRKIWEIPQTALHAFPQRYAITRASISVPAAAA